jgi:hypothetical protein
VRRPPDLDALIESFDRLSSGLVLLERRPLGEVRDAIEALEAAVQAHVTAAGAAPATTDGRARERSGRVGEIESDHRRFPTSLEQLWWFYRIVEGDDHGGHRQALGQYGRLLAEALRRHRADERAAPSDLPAADGSGPADRRQGNDK